METVDAKIKQTSLIKLFAKLPNDMREFFFQYAKDKKYRTGTLIANYLKQYLENPDKFDLTFNDILKYESLPKDNKYFSFYCNSDQEAKMKKLAKGNIRTLTEQNLHFLYGLYDYLITTEDTN